MYYVGEGTGLCLFLLTGNELERVNLVVVINEIRLLLYKCLLISALITTRLCMCRNIFHLNYLTYPSVQIFGPSTLALTRRKGLSGNFLLGAIHLGRPEEGGSCKSGHLFLFLKEIYC